MRIPTQSLLQRWLREEKGVHISIEYEWLEGVEWTYWWLAKKVIDGTNIKDHYNEAFSTYELALEDGLKYALENLVDEDN